MAKETRWTQTGGDMNPKDYGAVLTRRAESSLGEQIEIVEIEPRETGKGYYVQECEISFDDLTWEKNRDVARTHGHTRSYWEELPMEARAHDRIRHWGCVHLGGGSRYVEKWSDALPAKSNQIKWWR